MPMQDYDSNMLEYAPTEDQVEDKKVKIKKPKVEVEEKEPGLGDILRRQQLHHL